MVKQNSTPGPVVLFIRWQLGSASADKCQNVPGTYRHKCFDFHAIWHTRKTLLREQSGSLDCLILLLLLSTACIPQRQQINLMCEQIMALKKEFSRAACGKKQKLQCRKTETAGTRATADVGWRGSNEKVNLETRAKGKNRDNGAGKLNEKQEEFYK